MKPDFLKKLYTVRPDNPDDTDGIMEYFCNIIEAMPNNVYWLNRECITMGCNKNTLKLVGLEKLEDFVGITYEEMGNLANWTEGQAQSFKKDDMDVMESGQPKINVEEPPLYDESGNPVYYLSSRVPLFDNNNNVIGVIGISVDITDRKKLEQRLIESRAREERLKVLSSMGGMIAHELRTPLAGITFGMSTIKKNLTNLIDVYNAWSADRNEEPISPQKLGTLEQVCKDIQLSLAQVDNTIDTVLAGFNPSKVSENKLEKINIDELFNIFLYQYPLSEHERQLIDVKYCDTLIAKGVPQVILHILSNLVKNALYSIQEVGKGEISLCAIERKNIIEIHVKDTAKGIPKDQIEKIFEPFYTTKDTATSIGMGLYFCKLAIESMGGKIFCESESDEYADFVLQLLKG